MYEALFAKKTEEIVQKLEKAGFPRVKVKLKFDKLNPRVAGTASGKGNVITINTLYLKDHLYEVSDQTLAHEICHIYQFKYFPDAKQAHGPEWKSIMRSIGYRPETYHQMSVPEQKPRQKRKKVRYVYTNGVKKCYVTKQQHEKLTSGRVIGTLQGHPIVWTGKIEEYI